MQLLANENFPKTSVLILRKAGHDVVYVAEHSPGSDDSTVLLLARRENRIILTFDRDYGELIFRRKLPIPPGVVYFRQLPGNAEDPGETVLQVLRMKEIRLEGMFSTVEPTQIRQRSLKD